MHPTNSVSPGSNCSQDHANTGGHGGNLTRMIARQSSKTSHYELIFSIDARLTAFARLHVFALQSGARRAAAPRRFGYGCAPLWISSPWRLCVKKFDSLPQKTTNRPSDPSTTMNQSGSSSGSRAKASRRYHCFLLFPPSPWLPYSEQAAVKSTPRLADFSYTGRSIICSGSQGLNSRSTNRSRLQPGAGESPFGSRWQPLPSSPWPTCFRKPRAARRRSSSSRSASADGW
jgi:hypothetical protein